MFLHPTDVLKADIKEVRHIVDYKLDTYHKPEGADPNDEPDAQEAKEAEHSNVEYVKMELPCQGTFAKRMMHCQVQD